MFGFNSNQVQEPKKRTINHVIRRASYCSSQCDGDENMKMNTISPVSDTVWKIGCYKINPSTPSGRAL